jgi:hypothetical protein
MEQRLSVSRKICLSQVKKENIWVSAETPVLYSSPAGRMDCMAAEAFTPGESSDKGVP